MQNLTYEVLKDLINRKVETSAVTIYLPTRPGTLPADMAGSWIRFKNLVGQAIDALGKVGGQADLQASLRKKIDDLSDDNDFWEHQSDGLLMCASAGFMGMYRLPVGTAEYVAVGPHFQLAPLFGLLNDNLQYYVLVIAQHYPALFRGDMYDLKPTDLRLPETLEKGLHIDENNQRSEQGRSAEGTNSGGSFGFNGRGGFKDQRQEDRARFFRMIDKAVCEKADRSLPLILAGTESEVVEYRRLSNYPKLLESFIAGSFGGTQPRNLFEKARVPIEEELIRASRHKLVQEYMQLSGVRPDRVTTEIEQIQEAATRGRVGVLLMGAYSYPDDASGGKRSVIPRINFPGVDLTAVMSSIAQAVQARGGRIVNLAAGDVPGGAVAAAQLRY